jgi:hypothetical protein
MGLFVDAFASLEQSVRLAPHLTEAQLELGKLYLLAQDFAKAQLVLEQAPGMIEGHLLRSEIAAVEGQFAEALEAVNTALSRLLRSPGSIFCRRICRRLNVPCGRQSPGIPRWAKPIWRWASTISLSADGNRRSRRIGRPYR